MRITPLDRRARRSTVRRGLNPQVLALESRCLLSAGGLEPTDYEQYMLELINRARSDPAIEGYRLLEQAQREPAVKQAVEQFNWDLDHFFRVISSQAPSQPLAFNPRLVEGARDHSLSMLSRNIQEHSPSGFLTNPAVAVASDGLPYYQVQNASAWMTGENVFAYSRNVFSDSVQDHVDYFHAGFMIDWANPDFGHLKNILNTSYREVGLGVLTNADPTVPPGSSIAIDVGPVIVTQAFGFRSGNSYLTGTFYVDRDGDGFYTPGEGEGLGGVTIRAAGRNGEGVYQTQTWASGGYTLELPPGTYDVSASGNLPQELTKVVTIGSDNVGWSERLDANAEIANPPAPTPPAPTPPDPTLPPISISGKADIPILGNFSGNANGAIDFATYRPETAEWTISNPTTGTRTVTFGAPLLDIPVPGDYDGDGITDFATFRPDSDLLPGASQWFISLSGGGSKVVNFGQANLDIPVPGDYDGDGITDLAVYRPTTAEWFIIGSKVGAYRIQFGAPGLDIPVPADYNGDGKTNIATFRSDSDLLPGASQWFIRYSDTHAERIDFGMAYRDVPVPADYNGNGKADLAVFRPDSDLLPGASQWFIRYSATQGQMVNFGQGNLDIPMPADFDGDGKADLTVFRPTSADWFALRTRDGAIAQTVGQGGAIRSPITDILTPTVANYQPLAARIGIPASETSGHFEPTPTELTPLGSQPKVVPLNVSYEPPSSMIVPERPMQVAQHDSDSLETTAGRRPMLRWLSQAWWNRRGALLGLG